MRHHVILKSSALYVCILSIRCTLLERRFNPDNSLVSLTLSLTICITSCSNPVSVNKRSTKVTFLVVMGRSQLPTRTCSYNAY